MPEIIMKPSESDGLLSVVSALNGGAGRARAKGHIRSQPGRRFWKLDSEVRMPTLERRRGTCEGRNLEPRGLSVGFLIHGTSFLIRNQDLNLEHPT